MRERKRNRNKRGTEREMDIEGKRRTERESRRQTEKEEESEREIMLDVGFKLNIQNRRCICAFMFRMLFAIDRCKNIHIQLF